LGRCLLGWLAEPIEARNALAKPASDRVRRSLHWPVLAGRALDFVERTAAATVGPSAK